jgi:hypothetical protein
LPFLPYHAERQRHDHHGHAHAAQVRLGGHNGIVNDRKRVVEADEKEAVAEPGQERDEDLAVVRAERDGEHDDDEGGLGVEGDGVEDLKELRGRGEESERVSE